MSDTSVTFKKKYGWLAWSTRDILSMAAMGAAFGILLALLMYPYMLTVVLGPIVAWAWVGLYALPGFFIAYVLRRVGAAFLIAIIYALVMIPFTPYGPSMMLTGLVYAFMAEIGIAAATRYRNFSLFSMILGGVAAGIAMLIIYVIFWPESFQYPLPLVIGICLTTVVSSVIAAFVAKQLGDALARTGVLSGTALKRKDEEQEI
jgi:energy-coupling factor transport system substrate-specific component